MHSMDITKIAGAILMTALVAMVISFAGNILVPTGGHAPAEHGATAAGGHGGGHAGGADKKPEVKDPPVANLLAAASLETGKKLARKCLACHTLTKGGKNKLGPNLYGVLGRDRGSFPGFSYSAGMKAAGGKWSYRAIYAFLRNPKSAVKGTKMVFVVKKAKDRANLILFLRSLADSQLPLPAPEAMEKKPEEKKPEEKKAEKKATSHEPAEKKPAEKKAEEKKPAPVQTASAGAVLAAADPKRGAKLAKSKCRACHSLTKGGGNKVGPNLWGVVLRDRAMAEGYKYSSAMKAKGGKWTYADLLVFLKSPKKLVKGTKMTFRIPKAGDRADLIAYLRTLHDSPPPLPAK